MELNKPTGNLTRPRFGKRSRIVYQSANAISPPATISTILSPLERVRVDVAVGNSYTAIHRSSVEELANDLRTNHTSAILLSISESTPTNSAHIAHLIREFPRVPTYALITEDRKHNPLSLLLLGQAGVQSLIDARSPDGWNQLRDLLLHTVTRNSTFQDVLTTIVNVTPGCRHFFETLFSHSPCISNVQQLAKQLHTPAATLLSRFYRAKLPSPKRYVDFARLIRAASLLENHGLSVATVSQRLNYSSPQAFSRHTRHILELSPSQFRRNFSGDTIRRLFHDRLLTPYLKTFETFHPVASPHQWMIPQPPTSTL